MIFQTIPCQVYGNPKIGLDLSMVSKKASNGRPRWVDYGSAYDNSTITVTITTDGANRADLESIVREQNTSSAIAVVFENEEFLYAFTHEFTIQEYKLIKNPPRWIEYGYEVKLAPITPIDYLNLAGTRSTECGNMAYGTATIEQPEDFKPVYQTRKYSGVTHGSSFSSELPTNEYDRTTWTSQMLAGNARQLIDTILTNRGVEFFTVFPDDSYPFGIHSAGITGNRLCITDRSKYEIELVNGYIWKAKLGVYAL